MDSTLDRLRLFLAVQVAVFAAGTGGFMALEGLSLVDALYFTVVTVATVGYGDITPATDGGKLLAVVLILAGVGTFLGLFASGTDYLIERRREERRRERLHMVIGLFFGEVGTDLLRLLAAADPGLDELRGTLSEAPGGAEGDVGRVSGVLSRHDFRVDPARLSLEGVRGLLGQRRELLVRLLDNPNLERHEEFTELLRAVFHLEEELLCRTELGALPETDRKHLAGDAQRVYPLLTRQWVLHLAYLRANYGYLHSLAVRTNPFHPQPSPVVR
ncbi:MAG: potassium channel family protein [Deferrisomatales bacterium]